MRAALTHGIARSQWLSLSKSRRPSTGFEVLRAEPRQGALGGFVSRKPRILLRTPLESRSFSSLRDGVLLPAGGVAGGLFSFVGLRVHAPILFRSPKKDYANSYESDFLFRTAS
jgi:hypothetical protein